MKVLLYREILDLANVIISHRELKIIFFAVILCDDELAKVFFDLTSRAIPQRLRREANAQLQAWKNLTGLITNPLISRSERALDLLLESLQSIEHRAISVYLH